MGAYFDHCSSQKSSNCIDHYKWNDYCRYASSNLDMEVFYPYIRSNQTDKIQAKPSGPNEYKGLYAEMDKLFMKLCRFSNPLLGTILNGTLRMQWMSGAMEMYKYLEARYTYQYKV